LSGLACLQQPAVDPARLAHYRRTGDWAGAMTETLPDLMRLGDVLGRLRGVIGRTALLQHLARVPVFAGGPTHGRGGRRYVFTPDQYRRLVESLSCPSELSAAAVAHCSMSAAPSAARAFTNARALAMQLLQKPTEPTVRPNSGSVASTGRGQSSH